MKRLKKLMFKFNVRYVRINRSIQINRSDRSNLSIRTNRTLLNIIIRFLY